MSKSHELMNSSALSFSRERGGNVAMMWALMGAVLVGLIGITVDFTRAQALRNQMQNAADGAALVAERASNLSMNARTAAARAFFDAEMGDNGVNVTFNVRQLTDGGHEVDASMPMPVSLARIVSSEDWNLHVEAVAQADASPPIEVALVLDNTGSMAEDMPALRSAAADLVSDLLSLDGDTVRVALVPFVAQVNIGNGATQRAWTDTTGVAPMNGELFEDRMIGYRNRNISGTAATNSAFTGSTCQNLSTVPYFDDPATNSVNESYPGPYRVVWTRQGSRCFAFTPADGVNYHTLFDLLSNEDWKGCVEARPEPYDITDAPPNIGTPATLFVPFFWLDTGGTAGQSSTNTSSAANYNNNDNSYITDTFGDVRSTNTNYVTSTSNRPTMAQAPFITMGTTNPGLGAPSAQEQREARFFNVFKYGPRGGAASLDTTPADTRGPNRGCPTPIVPLTSNVNIVQSNVSAMQHWMGGGTNQAEGLAWGWRVLSPTAPFTEGLAFNQARDNVRKVIVLMSDGENTNVGGDAVMDSDFSAYNYLGFWTDHASGNLLTQLLFGVLHGVLPPGFQRDIDSRNDFVTYINNRQSTLCTNIKNAGIEIYVVRFREGNETLMRNCATSPAHYFRADNADQLSDAFDAIGSGIGELRLTH
jgi:Flp pilus assembly protein TadG